jgi:hypothetical protein
MITVMILIEMIQAFGNFTPSCTKCKWFVANNNGMFDYGFCRQFNGGKQTNTNILVSEYAIHCRKNEYMCGSEGYLFDRINIMNIIDKRFKFLKEPQKHLYQDNGELVDEDLDDIKEELHDLKEQLRDMEDEISGEVNEKNDLEEWERQYVKLQKKIAFYENKKFWEKYVI